MSAPFKDGDHVFFFEGEGFLKSKKYCTVADYNSSTRTYILVEASSMRRNIFKNISSYRVEKYDEKTDPNNLSFHNVVDKSESASTGSGGFSFGAPPASTGSGGFGFGAPHTGPFLFGSSRESPEPKADFGSKRPRSGLSVTLALEFAA